MCDTPLALCAQVEMKAIPNRIHVIVRARIGKIIMNSRTRSEKMIPYARSRP
jgi:hypothetical protein